MPNILPLNPILNPPAPACTPGVLVKCAGLPFNQYLAELLTEQMPLILFVAVLMVVGSGVQYMLSGFSPEGAKQAKQRIVGILLGVAFLLLIQLLVKNITPSISIGP